MPAINCQTEHGLPCSKDWIIFEILRTPPEIDADSDENPSAPAAGATEINHATFQITNTKLYVPVVTLAINKNIKFIENIK